MAEGMTVGVALGNDVDVEELVPDLPSSRWSP